ncbi:MAG: tyrosine-type recombinase/integrase, partial [Terriglobales bacterium]
AYALLEGMRQPDGVVFTFKGAPLKKIKTGWKAAIRRAGIRYLRFHDLRHTFNSRLMLAGVQQEIRKSLMGHSDGREVNSIYTHIELPDKREAIRKLERWVEEERKKQTEKPTTENEAHEQRPDPASNHRESGEDRGRGLGNADASAALPRRRCGARRPWSALGRR